MADLGITGDTVDAAAGADPISTRILLTQMAATYLQGHDPREPLASPIHGDYRGLPPLLVQVAENEALYADATRMVDAARRDGVEVELDTYPDSVHVFQVFDFLPRVGRRAGPNRQLRRHRVRPTRGSSGCPADPEGALSAPGATGWWGSPAHTQPEGLVQASRLACVLPGCLVRGLLSPHAAAHGEGGGDTLRTERREGIDLPAPRPPCWAGGQGAVGGAVGGRGHGQAERLAPGEAC
jgi:hypothetical protein